MINYDDFIDRVRRLSNDKPDPDCPDKDWTDMRRPPGLPADTFWASWITGGTEGGNCWGSSSVGFISPEGEPGELYGLLAVLEGADIRLSEYLTIKEDIVSGGSFTDDGYYGNSTRYGFKYITFDAVYDRLVEFGYAQAREAAPAP